MKQPPVLRAILKPTQQLQLRHWHTEDPGRVQFIVCIVGRSVSAAKMVWQLATFEFQKHAQHHPPKCVGAFGLIKAQRVFVFLASGRAPDVGVQRYNLSVITSPWALLGH